MLKGLIKETPRPIARPRAPALYSKVKQIKTRDKLLLHLAKRRTKRFLTRIFKALRTFTKISKFIGRQQKETGKALIVALKSNLLRLNYLKFSAIRHHSELLKVKAFLFIRQHLFLAKRIKNFKNKTKEYQICSFFYKINQLTSTNSIETDNLPFFYQRLFLKQVVLRIVKKQNKLHQINSAQQKIINRQKLDFFSKVRRKEALKFTDDYKTIQLYFNLFILKTLKQKIELDNIKRGFLKFFTGLFLEQVANNKLIREKSNITELFRRDKIKEKVFSEIKKVFFRKRDLRKLILMTVTRKREERLIKLKMQAALKRKTRSAEIKRTEKFNKIVKSIKIRNCLKWLVLFTRVELRKQEIKQKSKIEAKKRFFASLIENFDVCLVRNSTLSSLVNLFKTSVVTQICSSMILRNYFVAREVKKNRVDLFDRLKEDSIYRAFDKFEVTKKSIKISTFLKKLVTEKFRKNREKEQMNKFAFKRKTAAVRLFLNSQKKQKTLEIKVAQVKKNCLGLLSQKIVKKFGIK